MHKALIIILMIMIPCSLSQIRISRETFSDSEDANGTNWRYIHSNHTLIFDNLYRSTSGLFTIYFPFVLIEAYHIPNFTLILKNENTINVNDVGRDLVSVNAFEFRGSSGTDFIIQGDGKLTIKADSGKENMYELTGLEILQSNLVIKENAKIEIIMNNADELKGLYVSNSGLYMKGNSQLSVYIGKDKGSSTGIECQGAYLSDNITINSSLLSLSSQQLNPQWLYPHYNVKLSNNTNVTFITNGTMELPDNFFFHIGKDPIIINAIETLEEFNKSHKLTQKDANKSIIFSNYFIEKVENNKKDGESFLRISFFILLIFALFI